jgi:pantoate--beta-alanine ligase
VLTVVAKLLHIVQPDVLVLGQKDIQQVTVIRRMLIELDWSVRLRVVPTSREADGLARSSRNVYLSAEERPSALALSRSLRAVEAAFERGERRAETLRQVAHDVLEAAPGLITDYIAIADPDRLAPTDRVDVGTVVAVAGRVGTTRLIDNVILGDEDV